MGLKNKIQFLNYISSLKQFLIINLYQFTFDKFIFNFTKFKNINNKENNEIIELINYHKPDVLWVGMTAPKQEKWVYSNSNLLNVKFIGSVGAVFDYFAGTINPPPKWISKYGLQWAHRLFYNPRKFWKRTFISGPIFLLIIFKNILTNDLLNQYQNFQTSGMVVKKSTLDNFGGFKKSMKLTFVYEFLLRLTYNSARIMTIPRLGYKHVNMRESSLFWSYKNGNNILTDNEVKFWIDTAKKEYFFTNDRDIKYEETNS